MNRRRNPMRRHLFAAAIAVTLLSPWPARAADKTIMLNVDKADCALCAPIVKRTISSAVRVRTVQVAEATATLRAHATGTVDYAVTDVATVITASTHAG